MKQVRAVEGVANCIATRFFSFFD